MDLRGQTALLSIIFVLVGMMVLVPAITEKALATVHATASGHCGPEGQTHPCEFFFVSKFLRSKVGSWISEPSISGTLVTWSTTGGFGDEEGSVTYDVGGQTAVLSFKNPLFGFNACSIGGNIGGSCIAGAGQNAKFTYNLNNQALDKKCYYEASDLSGAVSGQIKTTCY